MYLSLTASYFVLYYPILLTSTTLLISIFQVCTTHSLTTSPTNSAPPPFFTPNPPNPPYFHRQGESLIPSYSALNIPFTAAIRILLCRSPSASVTSCEAFCSGACFFLRHKGLFANLKWRFRSISHSHFDYHVTSCFVTLQLACYLPESRIRILSLLSRTLVDHNIAAESEFPANYQSTSTGALQQITIFRKGLL